MRRKKIFSIFLLTTWISFFVVYAQIVLAAPPFSCTKVGNTINCTFNNPLNAGDLPALIKSIVAQVRPFAINLAAFGIIITGFYYTYRAGTGQDLKPAKQYLKYAVIGATIIGAAVVLVDAIVIFAGSLK